MHQIIYYFIKILAAVCENNYLCNVFFIVLDLRLTKRLDYGGSPFFCPYPKNEENQICECLMKRVR